MELMKVKEYSKVFDVSVQSVYQRIKAGSLEVEINDGVKYIKVLELPFNKAGTNVEQDPCKQIVKLYKGVVKDLRKQIKELKREKNKSYSQLEKLYDRSLGFNIPSLPHIEAEVFEVKSKKKKGRKKQSKN